MTKKMISVFKPISVDKLFFLRAFVSTNVEASSVFFIDGIWLVAKNQMTAASLVKSPDPEPQLALVLRSDRHLLIQAMRAKVCEKQHVTTKYNLVSCKNG